MLTGAKTLSEAIEQAFGRLDIERTRREYWSQNEFIFLKEALPRDLVAEHFTPAAQRLKPLLNRNYIPRHKKGGSVSYFTVREEAPEFVELYGAPGFMAFLAQLVGAPLMPCPAHDPHACALYYYTEPGDHISFHYDTSYYKGARYTILLGILDKSEQCKLVAQLYKDDPSRDMKTLELKTKPGDMVIFNGDKLWHAVTPLGEGEERIVLTMEYVTNQQMGTFKRLYSNLKDAFGYFGLRALWSAPKAVMRYTKLRS
jgi:hypothetical protein